MMQPELFSLLAVTFASLLSSFCLYDDHPTEERKVGKDH